MGAVLMIDKTMPVVKRVEKLTRSTSADFLNAQNEMDSINTYNNNNKNIDLIIIETALNNNNGYRILEKIRKKDSDIPIIVLTSLNKRRDFVKALKAGASDYILKPFDDHMLLERIKSNIKVDEKKLVSSVKGDFYRYFNTQYPLALENGTNLTFFMIVFFSSKKLEQSEQMQLYSDYGDIYFLRISEMFTEESLFIKYGNQIFIGAIPECDEAQSKQFEEGIAFVLEELTKQYEEDFKWMIETISIPNDVHDEKTSANELLDILQERVRDNIRLTMSNIDANIQFISSNDDSR